MRKQEHRSTGSNRVNGDEGSSLDSTEGSICHIIHKSTSCQSLSDAVRRSKGGACTSPKK